MLVAGWVLGWHTFRLANYGHYGLALFDDAYFFVRYAGNFVGNGVFEWNAGEGAVHGNTSQFYQFVVTLLYGATGGNGTFALLLAATLGAILYVAILPLAYRAVRPDLERNDRAIVAMVIAILAACDGQLHSLIGVGMETTWAMALVALSLWASFRLAASPSSTVTILANSVTVLLVYMVRPEATLIALMAPVGLILFGRNLRTRLAALVVCGGGLCLIGLFALACWFYYGSALPLSFSTKTHLLSALAENGPHGFGNPWRDFRDMLLFHKVEVLLAIGGIAMFARLPPVLRGAILGATALVVYHLTLVFPISGDYGRFYAPVVPVVVLLAASAVEWILQWSRSPGWRGRFALVLLACSTVFVAQRIVRAGWAITPELAEITEMRDFVREGRDPLAVAAEQMSFFAGRLDELVVAAGDDCSLAATEDGLLSAYARRNRIIDLSALHDPTMAKHGFSADRLLLQQRPDVLVEPYPIYARWIAQLEAHPALTRDYIKEERLGPTGPWIAFRRDSACAARVRKALYGR